MLPRFPYCSEIHAGNHAALEILVPLVEKHRAQLFNGYVSVFRPALQRFLE